MAYEFNHVHLKAPDPKATADWYVKAFGFTIVSDMVRPVGDRFIRCQTSGRRGYKHLRRAHQRVYGRRRC